ncbi:MAG: gliding motility-associated C-terminal domain-containing protein [Bacteroidetes bacterium]|nr:MAG: gliding motility-associated C-terminal domain-containing protein [Bacteroidota bacterium]
MKKLLIHTILGLLLLIGATDVSATHLVGGSMSYEYLGLQSNGKYAYRITVYMYRDCAASQVQFDGYIDVGAYTDDQFQNLANGLPTRLNLIQEKSVDPPAGGSNCAFQPNTCLRQGIYQGTVLLDASNDGYHLVYQRCCRNDQVNIISDLGQSYYAYIPPTSIRNNSPYFTDVPAPYICENDLVSLVNTARDIDGDSLVYKLGTPWGGGSNSDPIPGLPANWPGQLPNFPPVIYNTGYNVNIPFGFNGTATIDPRNGITEVLSPIRGLFSIAVDVEEYRNNVLLSRIRLDIQLIVIRCDPNAIPQINTSQNTFDFEVIEGEQICFDIIATDADNDNVKIEATSTTPLFTGGNGFGNTATFTSNTGQGTVNSQFCWTPSCGRAQGDSYLFTVEAKDDGCPPKRKLTNISILVKPFLGITSFNGPDRVCANANSLYTANGSTGSTYNWTVTGGTLLSGQGTNSISVDWGAGPTGSVEVTEISSGQCSGNAVLKSVQILPAPSQPNVSGKDTVCEFSMGEAYSIPPTNGFTYQWMITGGSIVSGATTPAVTVNWGAEGDASLGVVQVNSLGCGSDTTYFPVNISRSTIDSLYGSPSVCPHIRGVEYWAEPNETGSSFIWNILGGTQTEGGNTSSIRVDFGGPSNGYVEVQKINRYGCVSDPERLNVLINHALQGMTPLGPDSLCEFSSDIEYRVIYTNGSKYHWSIQGGTITQNDSTASIKVDWGSAGNGRILVFEESFDSVTNTPCLSLTNTLNVYLGPYPVANTIMGVDEICQSDSAELFYYTGYAGSSFTWDYDGPGIVSGQGNDSVYLTINTAGSYTVKLIETSNIGCVGPEVSKNIIVHPKPSTQGIFGDTIICYPRYSGNVYSASGFAPSNYQWSIDGGAITQGQGSEQIIVDFNGQVNSSLRLVEISEYGCIGDTLRTAILLDSPSVDLKVISVQPGDDTKMEMEWSLVNAPFYNSNFLIQRRLKGQSNQAFTTVGTIDGNGTSFEDSKLNTDANIYEYRIVGFNLCGDSLYSEVHRHVQINGFKPENDEYAVNINWTSYFGWSNPILNYEVYRKNGNADWVLMNDAGLDTTDQYSDGMLSFRQCYRIRTIESGTNTESWSNEICFDFKPILIVPNAFTSNGDGLNDQYEIAFASIKTYHIKIYDRWGELIFESQDPANFWDGKFKGSFCPEGVYVYTIRYTGSDDTIYNLKGNVTLLR